MRRHIRYVTLDSGNFTWVICMYTLKKFYTSSAGDPNGQNKFLGKH